MLRNLKLCHLSRDLNCFRKTLDYQIDLKVYFTIQLYIRNGYISLEHKRMSDISKDTNSFMKSSRGNTISQTGKTFWRYCYTTSHSVPLYT